MGIICIFILLLLCAINYKIDQTIFSPSVSFCLLFLCIFIFSNSGWFGMYQAPDEAYVLITLGVICFLLGSTFRRKKNVIPFYSTGKEINLTDCLNVRNYNLMIIICLLSLSVSILLIVNFLLSGGSIGDVYVVAAAATNGADNELSKGGVQSLLEGYIAYPLLYLIVPVSLVEFFSSYKKKYLIVAILFAFLRVGLDARRTYLTAFVMMIVICVYMHRKDFALFDNEMRRKVRNFKKYIIWIVGLFIYAFIFVSQQRSIASTGVDNSSFLQTLINYYGACVQFFAHSIKTMHIEYTLGFSSLRGALAPIWGIFRLFGVDNPDMLTNANQYLSDLHTNILQISPDKKFNSFATCFFQFYCDGGFLGIILLSFLYGYYARTIFDKMLLSKSKRAEATYVFFYANILMLSFVNMEIVAALNFWPLVLVRFLYPASKWIILK